MTIQYESNGLVTKEKLPKGLLQLLERKKNSNARIRQILRKHIYVLAIG
jgi:hypothetical protein